MNTKIHILLVDDDPLFRRLLGGKLAALGYDVIYAVDGNDGRETARRLNPDLILMDINMPGYEDGMATSMRIKSEEQTKDIPIILMSNMDISMEAESKMKELAADGFIHKSIETNELEKKVKMFLKKHKKSLANMTTKTEKLSKNTKTTISKSSKAKAKKTQKKS